MPSTTLTAASVLLALGVLTAPVLAQYTNPGSTGTPGSPTVPNNGPAGAPPGAPTPGTGTVPGVTSPSTGTTTPSSLPSVTPSSTTPQPGIYSPGTTTLPGAIPSTVPPGTGVSPVPGSTTGTSTRTPSTTSVPPR